MYIFCSINKARLDRVISNLLKSLERQNISEQFELILISYKGENLDIDIKSSVNIQVIKPEKATGFGESHNFAYDTIKPQTPFLIVNPDTYLHSDCLLNLLNTYNQIDRVGIVEARQMPFPHPKEYNHKTKETPWASGSCILVNPKIFGEIDGFDENFWMYVEDVDLSWRMWLAGYKVIYETSAVAYHYTGGYFDYSFDRYYLENFWCARNFIYIMYKFWGNSGERRAIRMLEATGYPSDFKRLVLDNYYQAKPNFENSMSVHKKEVSKFKQLIKITGFNLYHHFD